MSVALDSLPVTLIGHPWAPIGMGEQFRSHVHACNTVHLHHRVFDIFRYAQRADPAHDRLRAEDRFRDLQLVLKVKNGERGAEEWAAGVADDPQIRVIAAPLDTLGVRSLVNACDVFVSLHLSEGFGRGLGEAMSLGRLAL